MPLYTLGYVAKKAPPSLGSFPLARSIVMSIRIGCQSDAKVNQMTQYRRKEREKEGDKRDGRHERSYRVYRPNSRK